MQICAIVRNQHLFFNSTTPTQSAQVRPGQLIVLSSVYRLVFSTPLFNIIVLSSSYSKHVFSSFYSYSLDAMFYLDRPVSCPGPRIPSPTPGPSLPGDSGTSIGNGSVSGELASG